MILHRSRGLQALLCVLQAVTVVAAFWGWLFVYERVLPNRQLIGTTFFFFNYSLLAGLGIVVDYLRTVPDNTNFLNLRFVQNFGIAARKTVTIVLLLFFTLLAFKHQAVSREFLFAFIPILFFTLLVTNRIFPLVLARFVFSGNYVENTILLGSRRGVERIHEWMTGKVLYGVNIVGAVTDAPPQHTDIPHLGSIAQLEEHIRTAHATQVVAVDVPHSPVVINHLANVCQRLGVRLLLANDYELMLGRRISMTEEEGIFFISFHREPLENPFNRMVKRTVDLVVSSLVVVLILPVLALGVWIFQNFQSPGPLFFRQLRTGRLGEDFLLYKFRTMKPDNPDEARQAREHDERIFPAGRWLRRVSLDEMPQFINVLKGEMSVVGPRPHLREHDEIFRQKMISYGVRTFIKPGITGLAQVRDLRGEIHNDNDVIQRVRSDLDYLENWSMLLDMEIIFRTVFKVFFPSKHAR